MIAVCNSTPLIHLAITGQLGLLSRLFDRVICTTQVFDETVTSEGNRADALTIREAVEQGWLTVVPVPEQLSPLYIDLSATLGAGEASVIALALELKPDTLIIDERAASKKVQLLGLGAILTGTIGILIRAKKKNLLPELKPILNVLRATGFMPMGWQVRLACGENAELQKPSTLHQGCDGRSLLINIPTGCGKTMGRIGYKT